MIIEQGGGKPLAFSTHLPPEKEDTNKNEIQQKETGISQYCQHNKENMGKKIDGVVIILFQIFIRRRWRNGEIFNYGTWIFAKRQH